MKSSKQSSLNYKEQIIIELDRDSKRSYTVRPDALGLYKCNMKKNQICKGGPKLPWLCAETVKKVSKVLPKSEAKYESNNPNQ